MNRRNFFGRFGAAVVAATLWPVEFVSTQTRKLKATWTLHVTDGPIYHSPEVLEIVQEHARLISEDIDAQILKQLENRLDIEV